MLSCWLLPQSCSASFSHSPQFVIKSRFHLDTAAWDREKTANHKNIRRPMRDNTKGPSSPATCTCSGPSGATGISLSRAIHLHDCLPRTTIHGNCAFEESWKTAVKPPENLLHPWFSDFPVLTRSTMTAVLPSIWWCWKAFSCLAKFPSLGLWCRCLP